MTRVFMLYEDVSTTPEGELFGLLNKESILKVIEMEQQVVAWDKVSQ